MDQTNRFATVARGVLVASDSILLARYLPDGSLFLPGGHVEFGESASACLMRELAEEMKALPSGGEAPRFAGVYEQIWRHDGVTEHEFTLIFRIQFPPEAADHAPESREAHLSFEWFALDGLSSLWIVPEPMARDLPTIMRSTGYIGSDMGG